MDFFKNLTSTVGIVLVVIRQGDQFVIVQETSKHNCEWYLPAGRMEAGEHPIDAARREAYEEAGIHVDINGILRIDYTPCDYNIARLRVVYTASPADGAVLKSVPDRHTLQARWVNIEDLKKLPMRGGEVEEIFRYMLGGGMVYPLTLMMQEDIPFLIPRSRK